jgi:hypothetical protein
MSGAIAAVFALLLTVMLVWRWLRRRARRA